MTPMRRDSPSPLSEFVACLCDEANAGRIYDRPGPPETACLQIPNVVVRHRKILQGPNVPITAGRQAALQPLDAVIHDVPALFRRCFAPDTVERRFYDLPERPFEEHLAHLKAGELVGSVDRAASGGIRSDIAELVAAIITTRPRPDERWIAWLLVSPTMQHRGLGKLLVAAASNPTYRPQLAVTAHTPAHAFYQHLGFSELSEATLYSRSTPGTR